MKGPPARVIVGTAVFVFLAAINLVIAGSISRNQDIRTGAAHGTPTGILESVAVHLTCLEPTAIRLGSDACEASALGYDTSGFPIFDERKVSYEWGLSSVEGIGTLTFTDGAISGFLPQRVGVGDLWVIARQGGREAKKSVRIRVVPGEETFALVPRLEFTIKFQGVKSARANKKVKIVLLPAPVAIGGVSTEAGKEGEVKSHVTCAQRVTQAKNPETGQCTEFPTPCDVPSGWISPCNEAIVTFEGVEVLPEEDGRYTGSLLNPPAGGFEVFIKGPVHLSQSVARIPLFPPFTGKVDFSNIALAAGDIVGNDKIDIFDYNKLVSHFGPRIPSQGSLSDLDFDGDVDIFDYNLLVGNFGKKGDL